MPGITELSYVQEQQLKLGPDAWHEWVDSLGDDEAAALFYDWKSWARPSQLFPVGAEPGINSYLALAGRGYGKSRAGAEHTRDVAREWPGCRIALIGPTVADVRDTMILGESGIMACSPPWDEPVYYPSKRLVVWPNGSTGHTYSGDAPERLRGPQHHFGWVDELAAMQYPQYVYDMYQFGLRLGQHPYSLFTTTPKPIPIIKQLIKASTTDLRTGSTYDNAANLAPTMLEFILDMYEGTNIGLQEIYGRVLEQLEGALWERVLIERDRVHEAPVALKRIVVAIDPAVTSGPSSAETGIVAAGLGEDDHAYVLEDASLRGKPRQWARQATRLHYEHGSDMIVGEANNGGDLIETTLESSLYEDEPMPRYKKVTASRGKVTRAEPIVALYEQGRVHHVGTHPDLEEQMVTWDPAVGKSPDRVDALVWALSELMPRTRRALRARPKPKGW